jgi:hypothetical protein
MVVEGTLRCGSNLVAELRTECLDELAAFNREAAK